MNKRSKYYNNNVTVSKELKEEGYAVYISYYTPEYCINPNDYLLHCATTIVKSYKDFIKLVRVVFNDIDSNRLSNVK